MNHIRLCIALPATPRDLYEEFERMILDVLSDSPLDTRVVGDGDPIALDADMLLLIGDCQAFQEYPDVLKRRRGGRPRTALWLLDTLPPAALSDRASRIGSRLEIYNRALGFLRSHMQPAINLIPLSVRRKMGNAACSALLTGMERELQEPSHSELTKLDVNSRYEVVGRHHWIMSSLRDGRLDRIYVNTLPKQEFLTSMEIESHFVPLGYHPDMGTDLGMERDIDVLLVGELVYGRRKPIVESIRAELEKEGIGIMVVSGNCYGRRREELLNRSKICLNIARFSWDFPTIRLFMAMGCGSVVVSEDTCDPSPFVPGVHIISEPADRIPGAIIRLLQDKEERRRIADSAREFINTTCTLENAITRVLGSEGMLEHPPTAVSRL